MAGKDQGGLRYELKQQSETHWKWELVMCKYDEILLKNIANEHKVKKLLKRIV